MHFSERTPLLPLFLQRLWLKKTMLTPKRAGGSKTALSTKISCANLTDQPLENPPTSNLTRKPRLQPYHPARARIERAVVEKGGAEGYGLRRHGLIPFEWVLSSCTSHARIRIRDPSHLEPKGRHPAPRPLQLQAGEPPTFTDPQVQGCPAAANYKH